MARFNRAILLLECTMSTESSPNKFFNLTFKEVAALRDVSDAIQASVEEWLDYSMSTPFKYPDIKFVHDMDINSMYWHQLRDITVKNATVRVTMPKARDSYHWPTCSEAPAAEVIGKGRKSMYYVDYPNRLGEDVVSIVSTEATS